jgi:hypothetical protein
MPSLIEGVINERKNLSSFFIIFISLLMFGCTNKDPVQVQTDSENKKQVIPSTTGGYVKKIEGLHVTGTPIDIDIDSYHLSITGAVKNESLKNILKAIQ